MRIDSFPENVVEQIARVLAGAVTHADLREILERCGIEDVSHGEAAKWRRIYQSLLATQRRYGCGNNVAALVQAVMDPVRFVQNSQQFAEIRDRLNKVLLFAGLLLREDGKLEHSPQATTLSEAEQRARSLRQRLEARGVHPDVLKFCRPELLEGNYFHAVLEAVKSVAEKIRSKSGLTTDGADLVRRAFGGKQPLLRVNALRTESERSEQLGFQNLLIGLFGLFRNPTAHAPRITWPVSEQDALDLLSLVSYLHRRLDAAVLTSRPATC